ncbi:poly-beta-1,6-N-acetyl-D-glucosamine biosynthesis protein PgaD [Guyparkeria sp. TX1]|uniref:poly-beta-1,6-N-acetyl-D-glucosamine biosynthesis protein PgaD n=1 Tax=Guyparkeria sp. TX1 TaxID=3115001 RepID=UPI003977763C
MKRSRPRVPEIIERNDLESTGKRRVGQFVSLVAWVVWIYLFTPLIALIGWALGVGLFERYILDDPMGTLEAMQVYVLVILSAGLIFIGWASYNWLRFHNRERRHEPPPVSANELAHRFHISPEDAREIEYQRIVTVHFNDDAEIIEIIHEKPTDSDTDRTTALASPNAVPSSS